MNARMLRLAVPALTALCGLCAGAAAQNALDRNLQVGSGGVNPSRPNFRDEVNFRNSIITGNAPNGMSFRGNVGYRAPGEFQGTLGTNDLYSFRRDSFYSGLGGLGIRATDALQYQFDLTTGNRAVPRTSALAGFDGIYSRSGSGANAGEVRVPAVPTARAGEGYGAAPRGTQTAFDESGLSLLALRSPSAFVANRNLQPTYLGSVSTGQGAPAANISASVLRGISLDIPELPETGANAMPKAPPTDVTGSGMPLRPTEVQPGATGATRASGVTRPLQATDLSAPNGAVSTAVAGQRQDTRLNTSAAAPSPYESILARIQGQPGATGASGASGAAELPEWQRRLQELRDQLTQPDENQPGPDNGARGATGATGITGASGATGPSGITGATDIAPSRDRTSRNPDEDSTDRDRPRNRDVFSPDTLRLLRNGVGEVATLSAPSFDAYGTNMQAAQANLAAGRFFDAEERFIAALSAKPGDPMASVGRIHAELGAGMFLSATINLRSLLTQHPELIGTKYAPELLPAKDRIPKLIERLTALSAEPEGRGRDAGLLLAYVGHQAGDAAAVQKGLEVMSTPAPGGGPDQLTRLATLMREVWSKAPQPGSATPPTPAPATGK